MTKKSNFSSQWECRACTFLNDVHLHQCEICHMHRPTSSSSSNKFPLKNNKGGSELIDMTGGGNNHGRSCKNRGDQIKLNDYASMESARSRKRRRGKNNSCHLENNDVVVIDDSGKSSGFDLSVSRNHNGKTRTTKLEEGTSMPYSLGTASGGILHSARTSPDTIQRKNSARQHENNGKSLHVPLNLNSTIKSKRFDGVKVPSSNVISRRDECSNGKPGTKSSDHLSPTAKTKLFESIVSHIREKDLNSCSTKSNHHIQNKKESLKDDEDNLIHNTTVERKDRFNNSSLFSRPKNSQTNERQDRSDTMSSETISSATTSRKTTKNKVIGKEKPEILWEKCQKIMKETFHIASLRNLQPKAVKSALENKSQIIVMATGGGKSLCYQLPAVVLPGVTIVVTPLIALMMDQVRSLREKGIEAALVSSANGDRANMDVLQRLLGKQMNDVKGNRSSSRKKTPQTVKNGHDDKVQMKLPTSTINPIKLLYCTPELMETSRFRAVLTDLFKRDQLSMFAIDEAHCLSSWGHDFRPAYRKLSWFRSSFPDVPCMACTATATSKVISDIRQVLMMNNNEECHLSSFNRPNITYEVRYKDSMGDKEALNDMIKVIKEEHDAANKAGVPCSGIIYVHKRDDTIFLTSKIKENGIMAAPYHAGLNDDVRKEVHKKWTDGSIKVAVATIAFGMGIDLPHVRYVLHWSMSKSIEGFYQESGRCGRDSKPSRSIVYYSKDDASKFSFLIKKANEGKATMARKNGKDFFPNDRTLNALRGMVDYCTKLCCRRKFLLNHFGEEIDPKAHCKMACDFCRNPRAVENAMNGCSVLRAVKDVKKQMLEMKRKKFFESRGRWDGLHGDNNDDYSDVNSHYDEFESPESTLNEDLRVRGHDISDHSFNNISGKEVCSKRVSSAKDILSRYEAMEFEAGKKNGFVKFKNKSGVSNSSLLNTKSDSISIPKHMHKKMIPLEPSLKPSEQPNQILRGSKEIASDLNKVKADLAKLERAKNELLRKSSISSKGKISEANEMPPPPPTLSFRSNKSRRRR